MFDYFRKNVVYPEWGHELGIGQCVPFNHKGNVSFVIKESVQMASLRGRDPFIGTNVGMVNLFGVCWVQMIFEISDHNGKNPEYYETGFFPFIDSVRKDLLDFCNQDKLTFIFLYGEKQKDYIEASFPNELKIKIKCLAEMAIKNITPDLEENDIIPIMKIFHDMFSNPKKIRDEMRKHGGFLKIEMKDDQKLETL